MRNRLTISILLVLLALFTFTTAAQCKVVYVNVDGNNSNDGSTWALAKKTIQAGIDSSVSGDEIWVAKGTYVECVTLKPDVGLYGGFAGTEAVKADRNLATNATVIDGNQVSNVVTVSAGGTITTVIDGFTIRNGKGSGIYSSASNISISNNTITQNSTNINGGGIFCIKFLSLSISNNLIAGNNATYSGGGIWCSDSSPSNANISNNIIRGNNANYSGGGIGTSSFGTGYSNITISNNLISENTACDDGGGIACGYSNHILANNTIVGNLAEDGGGIYLFSGYSSEMSNNIVAFNSSGIFTINPEPTLHNNNIYNPDGYNYSGLIAGATDISADPKFASMQYGNFHIQQDSPCRNAGWNNAPGVNSTDIDGQSRVQPVDGTIDIGADESDGTAWNVVPVTVRVDGVNGNDANDGSSWTSAKKTVQSAIDKATPNAGEVWVKAGTYNERITLMMYAYVYGGFAGNETARDARNWKANITTLNGGKAGSVVTVRNAGYRVAAIDGFTIKNGSSLKGAGIYCENSSPIISNNTITGNAAAAYAGGIYCMYSSPIITNNKIVGNTSNSCGGGIYCCKNTFPLIISNCSISQNTAYTGGAIYCDYDTSSTISNNTITSNEGGGLYFSYRTLSTISNNTIAGNASCYSGHGGIFCGGSSLSILNNIIAFNSSGIYNDGSNTTTLRNNNMYANLGYNYSGVTAGTGDISANPKFVNNKIGDYHILPDSPCRNAGWNDAPGVSSIDIDGQPRIEPTGGTIDIGADESDGTVMEITPIIVRVDGVNGNDDNDGSSWLLAKKTVQSAIDMVPDYYSEVWVKADIYNERILLKYFRFIYGGFAGNENAKNQRNWAANATILDGGKAGSVVITPNIGVQGAIDGFTIRNGKAFYGGGIYCENAFPSIPNNLIISNNTIAGNIAAQKNDSTGFGGGIYFSSVSAVISNNLIANNIASNLGGGVYYSSGGSVTNNTIVNNSASVSGGGIHSSSPNLNISNNIVAFNSSGIRSTSRSNLHNNCVYNPGGYNYSPLSAGTSDIQTDPLFLAPQFGDYRLRPNSPCIGTGYNTAVLANSSDFEGKPRILPSGGVVDMGCFEYDFTPYLMKKVTTAKAIPEQITIQLQGKPITAAFDNAFYVEESDRIGGLKVISNQTVTPGDLATITGHLTTDNGERAFQADSVTTTPGTSANIPGALFISNKSVGGSNFFWNYNSENCGQQGITESFGLNNIGLLIKITGKFTWVSDHEFTINDGSGVTIKCITPNTVTLNPSWGYISVTGISSCEKVGTELHRLIRVRNSEDITTY